MLFSYRAILLVAPSLLAGLARGSRADVQDVLEDDLDLERFRAACPDYQHYAVFPQ